MTMSLERLFAIAGTAFAFLGVAAGAFGAHALRSRLGPDLLSIFETAVRYQMYHALALLAVAWAAGRWHAAPISWAGWLFISGIVIFAGSLYLLALTDTRWLGAITPVGGLCFLLGWICYCWGVIAAPE